MKWLLALALALILAPQLQAQSLPASVTATAPATAAFSLNITAPDEIKQVLALHLELLRYRELADLSDSELARLLTAAEENARELVATLGYFSPDIHIELLPASATAARMVQLSVVPGEPTLVGEVRIEFTGIITDDPLPLNQRQQIETRWALPTGTRFTQAGWAAAKQQALRQLTTQRFPTGQVANSLADIDPVAHRANLSVTLDSGPVYRLGQVVINGTQRYDNELVTRLARLSPGTDYEQTELVEAQQRLSDSGYFDSVFVSLDTATDPTQATVNIQLREAKLQKIVLGVGASTDSGARLSVEHTHHKLPLIGWQAVSKLRLDRETRSISTELTGPPRESNWRWVTSGLLQSQQVGSFDIDSQRLRVGRSQTGVQIDRNYYLQYDRSQTAATDTTAAVVADSVSANYAVTRRNFDSLPFPTRGWGVGAEVGGGTTLGSQREPYSRVLLHGLLYWPLGHRADSATTDARAGRLMLRAQAGAVFARDEATLPSTQLFLTGGDNSVRGYSLHDIGVVNAGGLTTAGRYLSVGSVEWQRPITRNGRLTDWESTLFVDAGAVADKPGELKTKVGVGVGARWKSPVGPLQIDLAYGVAVARFRLHLNVGFSF
jgi:translocation and assembly module TamA